MNPIYLPAIPAYCPRCGRVVGINCQPHHCGRCCRALDRAAKARQYNRVAIALLKTGLIVTAIMLAVMTLAGR